MIIHRAQRIKQKKEDRGIRIRSTLALFSMLAALTYYGVTGGDFKDPIQVHLPRTKAQAQEVKIVSPLSNYFLPMISPTATPKPVDPINPSSNVEWSDFIIAAKRIAPIYNYPLKVLVAQAALESARGTSNYARERNNYFGIAAYDWDPDNAYSFDNVEQGIIEYILLVRRQFPEAWDSRNDPDQMIELLENNSYGRMYATDPDYVSKLRNLPEWRAY